MKKKLVYFVLVVFYLFSFCMLNIEAKSYQSMNSKDVFYFTDNPNYNENIPYLYGADYTFKLKLRFNDESEYNSLNTILKIENEYQYQYDYNEIEDSIFIFEFNYDFLVSDFNNSRNTYYTFGYFSDILKNIFEDLKDNNNTICLICATDQNRFTDREFLEYVDFHIDTDLFYIFMSNLLDAAKNDSNDFRDEYSFLLNDCYYTDMRNSNTNSFTNSYIMKYWILPYFCSEFGYAGNYLNVYDFVLSLSLNYNIHFYYQENECSHNKYLEKYALLDMIVDDNFNYRYSDLVFNYYSSLDEYEPHWFDFDYYDYYDYEHFLPLSSKYMFVGGSFRTLNDTENYLEYVDEIRGRFAYDAQLYFYDYNDYFLNAAGLDYQTYKKDENHILFTYKAHSLTIKELLEEFVYSSIFDIDLSVYNNCPGVCQITHKMVDFGPDGDFKYNYRQEFDIDYVAELYKTQLD